MDSGEWAAWVGSIGSILAIGSGFAVAWWQRREEEKSRKMAEAIEAKGIATLIFFDLLLWCQRLERAQQHPDPVSQDVSPPESIVSRLDRMHVLGKVGEQIVWAAGGMLAQMVRSKEFREQWKFMDDQRRQGAQTVTRDIITHVSLDLAKTQRMVEAICRPVEAEIH